MIPGKKVTLRKVQWFLVKGKFEIHWRNGSWIPRGQERVGNRNETQKRRRKTGVRRERTGEFPSSSRPSGN